MNLFFQPIIQKAALGCLLFFTVTQVLSQEQGRVITVLDAYSGERIEGMSLIFKCSETTKLYSTNSLGQVQLPECTENLSISFQHPNYNETRSFESLPTSISLKPLPAVVSAAEISSYETASVVILKRPSYGSATSVLSAERIQSTDRSSLTNALNTIPGIKMDERGYGGSRRISIRGSFVRSPFAVRNLGLYYQDIPLNSPDGSSPIELIDPDEIGAMEIIKGPAGSQFGSGNGGVLFVRAATPNHFGTSIRNNFTAGSYGLLRNYSSVAYRKVNNWIKASFVTQSYDGYREQEFNSKSQVLVQGSYALSSKWSFFGMYQHYEGEWGLPGGLNLAELEEDPQQARPFSIDVDASLKRSRDLIALQQTVMILPNLSSRTSIYLNQYDKRNPYGTSPFFNGLKEEDAVGYGGRSTLEWWDNRLKFRWNAVLGAEWQQESGNFDEAPNLPGIVSNELRYSNNSEFTQGLFFFKGKAEYRKFSLEPSVSLNTYRVENQGYSFVLDSSLNSNFETDPELLFGLSLRKTYGNNEFLAAFNQGRSTPGLFELVDVETGILNIDLKAERGSNLELTYRRFSKNDRSFFEVLVYEFRLEESIIPTIDELERLSYSNGGQAIHRGLEANLNHRIDFTEDSFIERLLLRSALSLQDFNNVSGEDYRIPGVAYSTLSSGLSILFARTLRLDLNHYWSDQMPLNDANTDFLNAYHLLNGRIAWEKRIKAFELEVFAGVNNLTDTQYTSFPALNAAFGRYYNPAPGINYFGGLNLQWKLN